MITYHENTHTQRCRISNLPVTIEDRQNGWTERHDEPPKLGPGGQRMDPPGLKQPTEAELSKWSRPKLVAEVLRLQKCELREHNLLNFP